MMYRKYDIRKIYNKCYSDLLTGITQGKLYQYCTEVDKQAQDMFDTLIEQMKTTEGLTEELKEHD